jgi:hypothetical protein
VTLMAIFQPGWLRLGEALEFLTDGGLSSDGAKAAIRRLIQDRLQPRSLGGMFRLPGWRYSPRFRDRSWVTSPVIDWENSTIEAPYPFRARRITANYPTLIEISADGLHREFPCESDAAAPERTRLQAVIDEELPILRSQSVRPKRENLVDDIKDRHHLSGADAEAVVKVIWDSDGKPGRPPARNNKG